MTKARDIASAIPAPSTVDATELGYLDGVTSAIQTQLDAKTAKATLTTTGDIYYASAANTPARLAIGSTSDVLTVAGGIPSWAAPAGGGKVLQVIQDTFTSDYTTTSSSYSDTGLTVSITPSSASSKVLIIVAGSAFNYAPSGGNTSGLSYFQLLRDSTALQSTNVGRYNMSATYNGGIYGTVGLCHLDSPATTSATTYKVQGQNYDSASTTLSGSATNIASIIVMEIGA